MFLVHEFQRSIMYINWMINILKYTYEKAHELILVFLSKEASQENW